MEARFPKGAEEGEEEWEEEAAEGFVRRETEGSETETGHERDARKSEGQKDGEEKVG